MRGIVSRSIRCEEFLQQIDTQFLIDEQSPARLELIERAMNIENQLTEYNQTINQELTIVNENLSSIILHSSSLNDTPFRTLLNGKLRGKSYRLNFRQVEIDP